jgi:hypothetical protein
MFGLHLFVVADDARHLGMAAKVSGSVWAAQPVTMIGAPGFSRAKAANLLLGLAHRFGRHGAGVHDHRAMDPAAAASSFIASVS